MHVWVSTSSLDLVSSGAGSGSGDDPHALSTLVARIVATIQGRIFVMSPHPRRHANASQVLGRADLPRSGQPGSRLSSGCDQALRKKVERSNLWFSDMRELLGVRRRVLPFTAEHAHEAVHACAQFLRGRHPTNSTSETAVRMQWRRSKVSHCYSRGTTSLRRTFGPPCPRSTVLSRSSVRPSHPNQYLQPCGR